MPSSFTTVQFLDRVLDGLCADDLAPEFASLVAGQIYSLKVPLYDTSRTLAR